MVDPYTQVISLTHASRQHAAGTSLDNLSRVPIESRPPTSWVVVHSHCQSHLLAASRIQG